MGLGHQLDGPHHGVAVLEGDHFEVVAVGRIVGHHPLDHALRGAEREAGPVGVEGAEPDHLLVGLQGHVFGHRMPARQRRRVGRGRQRRQVDDLDADQPAQRGDHADLAAYGRAHDADQHVVGGPVALAGQRRGVGGAGQQAGRGEHGQARVVGHLQRRHRGAGDAGRLQQDGAARRAVFLGHLGQLARDDLAQFGLGGEDLGELGDLVAQRLLLAVELQLVVAGQAAQRRFEDVGGLDVGEVEHLHQPGPRLRGVVRGTDDLDDLVDVEQRDDQAVDQVQALFTLAPPVLRPTPHDLQPVVHIDLQQLTQPERARLAVDEGDVVDAERLLHRRQPVELLQHRLGDEAVFDLDDQSQALVPVGEVFEVGDALELLAGHQLLDLGDHALGADVVGELGDDDALAPRRDLLDLALGAHAERATTGLVGVAHPLQPDDGAARRQVGAGDIFHQLVERGVRLLDQVAGGGHDLGQVVRRHIGGHADRDAARAVDQQVGERRRHDDRLGLLAVVVGLEVDGVLVERVDHEHRRRGQPGLGVTHGGGQVVGRAEVAVAVDQRQAHRERLRQAHQGVVDRAVAVGMQLAHHVADDARGLDVAAVGAQAHLTHRVEDAPLHRLEAVARVGQGALIDHRVGVLEVARAHLGGDVDVDDPLLEILRWGCSRASGHLVLRGCLGRRAEGKRILLLYSSSNRSRQPAGQASDRRVGRRQKRVRPRTGRDRDVSAPGDDGMSQGSSGVSIVSLKPRPAEAGRTVTICLSSRIRPAGHVRILAVFPRLSQTCSMRDGELDQAIAWSYRSAHGFPLITEAS